jgi:GNAT superfamily N-acetyltransferase
MAGLKIGIRELPGGLLLQQTSAVHAPGLEELQKIVFPTLADDERFKAEHYIQHIKIFPQGQFVITHDDEVIGMISTMRYHFVPGDYQHTFKQIAAGGWMTNHDPDGDWLYCLDIGIHPAYRGQNLSKALWLASQATAASLGLRGQITVGMMNGYGEVSDQVSAESYYKEISEGKRTDPTITTQLKIGFKPLALIPGYLNDPTCGNYGVFLKWELKP